MKTSLTDHLFVFLQRCIPARFVGAIIYRLARSRTNWFKNSFIRVFCHIYKVDTAEAELPVPQGYACFNDFFTRSLRPGARPADTNPGTVVAPADGTIAQLGHAEHGRLLQAKGHTFSAAGLLGDADLAERLQACSYTTIYLAPYNYHRIHMPVDGTPEQTLFIPGRLYSVNARTTATVPDLYAVNERLVCEFSSPQGPFAMVLVGAMNVASISTVWDGEIAPPDDGMIAQRRFAGSQPALMRGDYMGHFNMGSTVVLLGPPAISGWQAGLSAGDKVRVGQRIGQIATDD